MWGVGESFELPNGKGGVILKFWRIFIGFTATELYSSTLLIFKQSWQQHKNKKLQNIKF